MSFEKRIPWSALAVFPALFGLGAPAEAATVTIVPTMDNSMMEDDPAASCAIGNLYGGETRFALSRRALLAFDIAAQIPAGSTINSAELRMTILRVGPFSAPTDMFTLRRLTASWGESSGEGASQCFSGTGTPAADGDATWSHRFWPGTPWSSPGGDFALGATATIAMPTGGAFVWPTQPNMVADVQAWLDDPANNFGWIIIGDESLPTTAREFSSREGAPPELVVNYSIPATTPPEVPDGRFAPPLRVNKLSADGVDLQLTWDTAHCTLNLDHNIVYGTRSTLPASPGGMYGLQGVVCDPGAGSPFSWLGSPDPAILDPASKLLWMLVIANDGATVEGSWGRDSLLQERNGPGTNGSENACGILDKSLANVCGQKF